MCGAAPEAQTVGDFLQWLELRACDNVDGKSLMESNGVNERSPLTNLSRDALGAPLQELLSEFDAYGREVEAEIWQKPQRQRKGKREKRGTPQRVGESTSSRAMSLAVAPSAEPFSATVNEKEDQKETVTFAVVIHGSEARERPANAMKEALNSLFGERFKLFELGKGHNVSKGLLFAVWQLLETMESDSKLSGQLLIYFCGEVATHSCLRSLSDPQMTERDGGVSPLGFNLVCRRTEDEGEGEKLLSLSAIHNLQTKSNLPTLLLVDGSHSGEAAPRLSLCSPGTEDQHNAFTVFSHCPQSEFPSGCVANEFLTFSAAHVGDTVTSPALVESLSKAVAKSGESPIFLDNSTVPFISESSLSGFCFTVPPLRPNS